MNELVIAIIIVVFIIIAIIDYACCVMSGIDEERCNKEREKREKHKNDEL